MKWKYIFFEKYPCVCVCLFFLVGVGGASSPASSPTKPRPHLYRVCILSVGPVLIRWIRRRCCRYPYYPIPFSLAARGLGVRARHFSVFPSSGHFRLLLFLLRAHAHTHTCSFITSRDDLLFPLIRGSEVRHSLHLYFFFFSSS